MPSTGAVSGALDRLVIASDDNVSTRNQNLPPTRLPEPSSPPHAAVSKLNPNGGNGAHSPAHFEHSPEVGSPTKYFTKMLENNCSAGKARRGTNGKYVTEFDERVSRCGGNREPFLIGVAGGTASGKTTVCDLIMQNLQEQRVVLIAQDSFYRPLTAYEHENVGAYNFDHPDAIDTKYLVEVLQKLMLRQSVDIPVYDFVTHSRSDEKIHIESGDVIIIEGILVLAMEEIRAMCHMKVFVDTDDDLRLARRLKRDTVDRGRSVDGVITQYTTFVKPMFDTFVSPSKKYADVIIPWAQGENTVAIDLIVQHIRTKLGQNDLRRIYRNLVVLPPQFQIRGMHTIIRDRRVNRSDFVFYSDRIIRLVVEHGLGHLPFSEQVVLTPTGDQYKGVTFCSKLCGVSIIRSGEAMENALRACCKGIKIGKLLIERRDKDGMIARQASASGDLSSPVMYNSRIHYEKLPHDIADRYVLLLDPILATGVSAQSAIDLLLERGVQEEKILFLTVIASTQGVHHLCTRYPRMKIITSEVDAGLSDDNKVLPGVGEFGDRYFGTEMPSIVQLQPPSDSRMFD
jgi:uridine kinase|tara:strand:- start:6875 stop:8584 length:1710 start_codon:yes stop_codon:yes gene_type:complete